MPIINSVIAGGGTTPTGTKNITANGTHDVAAYEYADVQVPTTAPNNYLELEKNSNNELVYKTNTTHFVDFTGVQYIGLNVSLAGAYENNTNLTGTLDLSDLVGTKEGTCSGTFKNTFKGCTNLTGVLMPKFVSLRGEGCCQQMFGGSGISGTLILDFNGGFIGAYGAAWMFANCLGITAVKIYNLPTNGSNCIQSMFSGCTGITTAEIYKIGNFSFSYAFTGLFTNCTSLVRAKINTGSIFAGSVGTSMFSGCTSLREVWWNLPGWGSSYKGALSNMLSGCTGVTVHFPMAIQSTIESWSDVTNGFGGTNTTVLFDIVTSLTGADTNIYTRQEKDSTNSATAWVYNNVLYYTSGTNEPAVGDTIYSDAACTTAVTTISAIA